MGFFGIDGPFFRIGTVIADVMILGILWIIGSLPIVTIGASTTAVFYVTTKRANGRDGYLWADFWKSYRLNFFASTKVFLTIFIIYAILIFNIWGLSFENDLGNWILAIQFVVFIEITFISMYAFPLISRFELKYIQVFKTAFILANRHILITISNLALLVGVVFMVDFMPPFIIIAPGVYIYFSSYLFVKAFKKYRPDLDPELAVGQLEPLQLDLDKDEKKDEGNEPVSEKKENEPKKETVVYIEEAEHQYYDSNSNVLNLDRLKNIAGDKKEDE